MAGCSLYIHGGFFFEVGGGMSPTGVAASMVSVVWPMERVGGNRELVNAHGCRTPAEGALEPGHPTSLITPVWMVVPLPGVSPLCPFNGSSVGVEKPDGSIDPKWGLSFRNAGMEKRGPE